MKERLEIIKRKYEELTAELSRPEVLSDYNKVKILAKEQKDLLPLVEKYGEYNNLLTEIEEANEMLTDHELVEMAKSEIEQLTLKKEILIKEIEELLIPKDENDGKNVIMEIRGAAGGDEANIFAGDLFHMYARFAEKNNWKIEVISEVAGTSGGYAQIEFMIKGANVYSKLKFENGSHRVQRIPATETQGRVHTSTSTVLVIPEIETVDIEVKEADLRIDVYRSSGAGGQHVNTTDSAVRITHVPTNIVVTCQNERSQLQNKEKAMNILKVKLNDEMQRRQDQEFGNQRKNKIGTGDRSEKIRTYNYPQNRVTDHRINFSLMELDRIMEGNVDPIIEALTIEDQRLKLQG